MKTKKLKLIQRALAALLTITMVLGIVPMTAFAEETSQTAQEAAAMRALESRVFTVGEEQLTIEDLEQSTFVMVTTAEGRNLTVPGNEIRLYLLGNDIIQVDGTITVSLEYITQYGQARIKIYANSSHKLKTIEANNVECRDSSGKLYIKCDIAKKSNILGTSITATSDPFTYAQGTAPYFYYDYILVTCEQNDRGFFAKKPSPYS